MNKSEGFYYWCGAFIGLVMAFGFNSVINIDVFINRLFGIVFLILLISFIILVKKKEKKK